MKSQFFAIAGAMLCATLWTDRVHSTIDRPGACTPTQPPLSEHGRWALVFDFDDPNQPANGCLVVWLPGASAPEHRVIACDVVGAVRFDQGLAVFEGGHIECPHFSIAEVGETERYAEFFIAANGMVEQPVTAPRQAATLYWHPSVEFRAGALGKSLYGLETRLGDTRVASPFPTIPVPGTRDENVRFDYADGTLTHGLNGGVIGAGQIGRSFSYDNRPATIYIGRNPLTGSTLRGVSIDQIVIDPNISGGL